MVTQPLVSETVHADQKLAKQVVPDLSRPRSNNYQRKSSAQATGRRPPAAAVSVSDSPVGLRRLLACDFALSTLSLAPAALAQEGPGKIQGGSSAVSDLLAKKAKRTFSTASPSQTSPETAVQLEQTQGPAAAPAEPPTALPDAADLKETASKLSGKASEAAGQATSAASRLSDKASEPTGQATSAASKLAEAAPQAPGQADSAVSKIQDAASSSGSSIQEEAADLANSVQTSTGPSLKPPSLEYPSGGSSTSSGGGADAVGKQANEALEQLSKQASEAAGSLSQQAQDTLQSASAAADQATAGVRQSFSEVAGDAAGAVQQLGQQLGAAASSAKASLPAPIQQALDVVTPAIDSAVHQIQSDSRLSTAAVAIGVSLPVVLWFRARYGGYGGPLSAMQAFELLQETDAVFVDIRPDEQREADGVAELKRGARRKGVLVPFTGLPTSTSRQLRRPNEVAAQLAAVQIASLTQIGNNTKIIVVDDRGKDAIRIARSLRQFGRAKAYVLEGGFKSWVRQGLPVREGTVYGSSVLETFTEDVEVFAENATTVARSPAALIALLAAVGGTGATIYDYHKVLEFLGVLGLLVTAVFRYNSFKELAQDLYGGLKNIGKAADTVASVPAVASAGASSLTSASSSLTSSFQDTRSSESYSPADVTKAAANPPAAPVSSPSSNGDRDQESYQPVAAKGSEEQEKPEPVPVSSPPEPSNPAGPGQPDDSEKAAEKAQPEEEQRLDEDAGKAKDATPLPSEINK